MKIISFIASLAVALLVLAQPAQAQHIRTQPTCTYLATVGAFVSGDGGEINIGGALTNTFGIYNCVKPNSLRVQVARYNTDAERDHLVAFLSDPGNVSHAFPTILCEHAMIDSFHLFNPTKPTRYEREHYAAWAARYAKGHGCEIYG